MPDNCQREKEIFGEALELSSPEERRTFVKGACGDDEPLRQAVEALLEAFESAIGFIPERAEDSASGVDAEPPGEKPGDRIGRYKLREKIGEGGCGVVYVAEQIEPVRRRVALKVIKLGMDTKQVVARFEAERQALAMMDHPNIAKVLDAGTTDTGRPYFVMELVRGVKITDYCDQNQLSTRERLELFIKVCQAVQHAHHKGVIHRDLKPSNILVTLHDGVPVPKVIDFGIAKAIEGRLSDSTIYTQLHQFMGTPAYMSPEQAEMSGLDIDTRSDIYTLGVLLYELLTGRPPFDPKALLASGLDAMRKTIRETEPTRPSNLLTQELKAAEMAARRPTEGLAIPTQEEVNAGLRRRRLKEQILRMRGDLDWIVMKCLEKNRSRRYETANGLAMDLQRHLRNEPVGARPPSAAYLLRKAAHRNKLPFAAGAAVVAALAAGLAVATAFFVRERAALRQVQTANVAAERNAYSAKMLLAQADWDNHDVGGLRGIFEDTAAHPNRGFEWFYWQRMRRLDSATLRGHLGPVFAVAVSPDGRRMPSASMDGAVKVWDPDSGRELRSIPAHAGPVLFVGFSPDGRRMVSGGRDHTVRIWETESGRELRTISGHSNWVWSVAFSPDGRRIASGSADGTVKLWDTETGRGTRVLASHTNHIESVAFSPDGSRIASGSDDGAIKIWETETGRELRTIEGGMGKVLAVAFSPDGRRIVAGGEEHYVKVWETQTGLESLVLKGHAYQVWGVALSPDGRRIVSGGKDHLARVWDAETGRELRSLTGHSEWVNATAFSPDGRRIVTGSTDQTIKVWEAEGGLELLTLRGHSNGIISVAFTPDGRRVASSGWDRTIRLWDSNTGREVACFDGGEEDSGEFAFSPDGRRMAFGEIDHAVSVREAESGRVLLTLKGHTASVRSVAFSPDGRRIASGSADRTVKIWAADTGSELLMFRFAVIWERSIMIIEACWTSRITIVEEGFGGELAEEGRREVCFRRASLVLDTREAGGGGVLASVAPAGWTGSGRARRGRAGSRGVAAPGPARRPRAGGPVGVGPGRKVGFA